MIKIVLYMPNILAVETEKQIKRQNETRRDAGGLVSQRQTDRPTVDDIMRPILRKDCRDALLRQRLRR